MNAILKKYLETGEINHAYLMVGNLDYSKQIVLEIAKELLKIGEESLESHPDYYYKNIDGFGIKDSLLLREKTSTRPLLGSKKVFVIETHSFTPESANALLKTTEEPPEGTHFFVITSSAETIIPTLRSRFSVVEIKENEKGTSLKYQDSIEKFLRLSPTKRLKEKEFESFSKGENLIEMLDEMELFLHKLMRKIPTEKTTEMEKILGSIKDIEKVKPFLRYKRSFEKMIFEHLALTLPQL